MLVGWGSNDAGQLNSPDGNDFVAIAAGAAHSLALKSDGSIVAWGSNTEGQLNVPEGNDFVAITAGHAHSLALKSDGSIVGWGANGRGQIDVPDGNDFVAIAAGGESSLVLKADGSLAACGVRVGVPDGNGFVAIAAGNNYGLALKGEGWLVGYGSEPSYVPLGNNFVAIAAGYRHSLALVEKPANSVPVACITGRYHQIVQAENSGRATVTLDGSCSKDVDSTAGTNDDIVSFDWYEADTLLGSGQIIDCNFPLGTHAVKLVVTDSFGQTDDDRVVITVQDTPAPAVASGDVVGWGFNNWGQAAPRGPLGCVAVAGGGSHSFALKSDGSLVAWGYGMTDVPKGNDFVAIAAGDSHNLALKSDGSLVSWGKTEHGLTSVPWGYDFVAIAAGRWHSLALKSDGSLVAWGRNMFGVLEVPDGNDFVAIASGPHHNLALKSDGSLVTWGFPAGGLTNVPAGNDFAAIAAGAEYSLALKSDGSIVGWGRPEYDYGQATPPVGNDFVAIAVGYYHALALKSDGSIIGWGRNDLGQCNVPEGNDFVAIAGGSNHNLAIYQYPLSGDEEQLLPAQLIAAEWYVSPSGSPTGDGSQANPWDLATALGWEGYWDPAVTPPSKAEQIKPGDTVWVAGGIYKGPFVKSAILRGFNGLPIIYRAMPDQRVTLTADKTDEYVLENSASYIWFWGFEVTVDGAPELSSYAVCQHSPATGFKYINMVVHDCPYRGGFGGVGIGGEFYGCLSYRNGLWGNPTTSGFTLQNCPDQVGGSVEDLPWKRFIDCVAFDNYMAGFLNFAQGGKLANILYDGCVSFDNGRRWNWAAESYSFCSGGEQRDDNFVLRECFAYCPPDSKAKIAALLGWDITPWNGRVTVEDSIFVGGLRSVILAYWEQVMFRKNTCYNHNQYVGEGYFGPRWRRVFSMAAPADVSQYVFDDNTYYQDSECFSQMNGIDYLTFDDWQAASGWDANSTNTIGAPNDVWVFLRPNKYEPDRAHLIVYNWPKTGTVSVEMAKLWCLENGPQYEYRIVNVEDIWGEPVAEGTLNNGAIEVPMTGVYAPEFACYLVTRRVPY